MWWCRIYLSILIKILKDFLKKYVCIWRCWTFAPVLPLCKFSFSSSYLFSAYQSLQGTQASENSWHIWTAFHNVSFLCYPIVNIKINAAQGHTTSRFGRHSQGQDNLSQSYNLRKDVVLQQWILAWGSGRNHLRCSGPYRFPLLFKAVILPSAVEVGGVCWMQYVCMQEGTDCRFVKLFFFRVKWDDEVVFCVFSPSNYMLCRILPSPVEVIWHDNTQHAC